MRLLFRSLALLVVLAGCSVALADDDDTGIGTPTRVDLGACECQP